MASAEPLLRSGALRLGDIVGGQVVLPDVDGSILQRLGFAAGDRISRIDGHPAADLARTRATFHAARDGQPRFTVDLVRGGKPCRSSFVSRPKDASASC